MSYGRAGGRRPVALIVGPGDRFLSGVSYYTAQLTDALAERGPVAALLLRRLCPRVLYPGRARVGSTDGMLPLPKVSVFNGLDWFWGPSAVGAWRFWRRTRPTVVILQWWTATVLHSYLVIAWLAKRTGARLVIEFHETQDIGEAGLPLVGRYTRAGMNLLLERADAIVVHSDFDRRELATAYPRLAHLPVEVILHGPYAQHVEHQQFSPRADPVAEQPVRALVFGVVRPYKGHADLADAVRLLVESGVDIHLSVVGEVWQGYRQPLEQLRSVLPADRLTIVDRYVADHEVPGFFATADLVVLPYRRSSASGPLHIAMSCGLPVVTTSVGGLIEATEGYTGAVLVPPGDPEALADGIRNALPLVGRTHSDPHSWRRSAEQYEALLNRVDADWGRSVSALPSSLPA
ncbi:glycosyltransferase family 4 protein [Mycolicibacterium vaccae]|uniref:Group 1 glycosyl transferase n=1 Tax=Mycolicibacterium vaccae ATCC 25954 TaxID=1194972 RepID=K0VL49_MYCVA|nr:glycosyltransferase family 4 protein [Mycolicibacterium vaccae]ANI38520.1 group 1 glycosyl transferase [Mycolicibacterium vaccae 95051]EJZ11829.1 group 1 glycosyl transferase [Mycolicibacterium vaccae ATCC 25954]MCV7061445.1 glycosyltransferase family 4 protein [Mycolicibacterium vaccae]